MFTSLAVVFAFTAIVVTFTPVLGWWVGVLSQPWDDARGDTLIVLGAGANPDGTVDYHSYHRALQAAYLYRERGFRHIFVTGAIAAPAIRDYLIGAGVPASAIQVENASHNTRENALFTAAALKNQTGSKVLLTSDYHTYRASRVFRKAGLDLRTSPAPDAGKRLSQVLDRWPVFLDLSVETAKIAVYRLRGWM